MPERKRFFFHWGLPLHCLKLNLNKQENQQLGRTYTDIISKGTDKRRSRRCWEARAQKRPLRWRGRFANNNRKMIDNAEKSNFKQINISQVSNVDEVCPPWVRKSSRREPLPAAWRYFTYSIFLNIFHFHSFHFLNIVKIIMLAEISLTKHLWPAYNTKLYLLL